MNQALAELSTLHRIFVFEYIKDFVASRAAERAGLEKSQGSRLLGNLDIQRAITVVMHERHERLQVDSDWVLRQLADMFSADLADIFVPGTNTMRPVHEWPEVWRKMCSGVKVRAIYEVEDGMRDLVGYVQDVKVIDRLKALELIGKHTDIRAFTERIELTTDKELTAQLMRGRQRARVRAGHQDVIDVTPREETPSEQPKQIDFMGNPQEVDQ
ncbi:MAG: terminase small subunit [Gammaproteobacteria bacterium]|nr:terminase small subunit [Gammaproteobacteria bacterium]